MDIERSARTIFCLDKREWKRSDITQVSLSFGIEEV